MRFLDLKQPLIDNIDAGISSHIESPPGTGKSDFIEDLVKWLSKRDGFEWGWATCFLATYQPTDLMGYMVPTKTEHGLASVFTTPNWMMTRPTEEHPHGRHINTYKRGVVFLDEWSQADGDTKKAAAQLKLKGEVGPHKLARGISVISAGNRKEDRSGVTKEFDFVINRENLFKIDPDFPSWEAWAIEHGVLPLTITFAKQNPQVVFDAKVPENQGPWTTPRSLCMVDRLMQVKMQRTGGVLPDDPITAEQISGIMGAGAAQYMAFIKLEREMPKYEEIIANPNECRVPTKPDACMLVCYQLAHMIKEKDAAAVVTYMERLPKEFAVTFATTACKKKPLLVNDKAFEGWAKKNSSLMAAIALVSKAA
jgi:hypothetical protein